MTTVQTQTSPISGGGVTAQVTPNTTVALG
jgi:hypothetical protein